MLDLPDVTLICVAEPGVAPFLFAADVCRHYCRFGDVKILTSHDFPAHEIVRIPRLTYDEYSRFVLQELHKYVETPYALIFQADGFILNPDAWTDEFLEYDYIGAPFWFGSECTVGNGGFSLRSKRLLEATSRYVNSPPWTPEDQIVCRKYGAFLREKGFRFAPPDLARRFAKEGNPREGFAWDGQFGFHNLRTTDLSKWVCPDSADIRPLPLLQKTWELERTVAKYASASRRQLQVHQRKQNALQEQLSSLQWILRSMLLESAAAQAGFSNGTRDFKEEDLQDLVVEVFADHPEAVGLGVCFSGKRRSDNGPVKVECEKRLAVCRALCCTLRVYLTKEEVHNPSFCLNVEQPFSLKRDTDTQLCKHWQNGGCQVYRHRPAVCARYSCVKDRRIWENFQEMILSDYGKKALERLVTQGMAPNE